MLGEALAEHQARLTGPRDADPARRTSYRQLLEQFGQIRGGSLFYPYLGSGLGHGALVELADGSVKYDMIGGIGVHYLGHSHPALMQAGLDAALRDTIMQGNLEQNVESAQLAEQFVRLAARGGAVLPHCFLTTSGAMANENALKLILHRKHPAARVLAFEHCFAGRTLALSQITDKPAYRAGLPTTLNVDYVPFYDAEQPAASTERAVTVLRQHLHRHPGQHAAMIFELILGEGGYYPGSHDFFAALMTVLREHDVATLVDEIQTFGRTTQPFAFQHFELDEYVDVVTVGKLTQVCATLFGDAYRPPPGLISQTFTGSGSAIAAALRLLEYMETQGFFGAEGRVMRLSSAFVRRLRAMAEAHPDLLRGPFGLGAMIAFTPLDGQRDTAIRLLHELFARGVIAFLAGEAPTRVRFLPPIGALTEDDIDAVCDILLAALKSLA